MDDGHGTLRDLLGIEDADIVSQHVQVVQERNEIPFAFLGVLGFGNERGFLEGLAVAGPVGLCDGFVPGEVAQAVEQASGGGAALLEVVGLGGVDDGLPVVVVVHGDEAVVDAGELAGEGVEFLGRVDPGVGGQIGVNDPTGGLVLQLVAASHGAGGGVNWREEEEDIAIGNGEIEDDFSFWSFEAAHGVALEGYT